MLDRLSRLRRQAAFTYPIQPAPRTAVLVAGFRSGGMIRVFPGGWDAQARSFAPAAVAATLDQFKELTRVEIPSLTHAVIVVGRESDARVSDTDRERLWQAFHVPAFEQIIGEENELLAMECEAHDGLHIESAKLPAGAGRIEQSVCGCGRKTPRLILEERTELLRRVAAYAR